MSLKNDVWMSYKWVWGWKQPFRGVGRERERDSVKEEAIWKRTKLKRKGRRNY